ncbi:MAG: rhomboid family intramembrane serine protease [Verrucomicrobiales bacterium]
MEGQQNAEAGEGRRWFLNDWPKGGVWFRDLIPATQPWGQFTLLPPVPENARGSYGVRVGAYTKVDSERYEPGEVVVVDTEDDFRRLFSSQGAVTDFIFPWFERMIPLTLMVPHRERIELFAYRRDVRARFFKAVLLTIALVAVAFLVPNLSMLALLGAAFYGLFPLVESSMDWMRRVDRYSVEELNRRMVNHEFFRRWIIDHDTRLLKGGLAILIAVFVGQMLVGTNRSIEAAALVKESVIEEGEWWRVVTSGLMHGDVIHILFNGMALYSLGRVLVALLGPAFLTFVFFFSVVTGSLASLWLGAGNNSVGASGGILGCLGFLLVVTVKFKAALPGFLQASLIQSTLVVAIFGLLGNQFIDNAAHAGGFLGGIFLGGIFYPWLKLAPGESSVGIRLLSWLSVAALAGAVGKIGWELWRVSPF